MRKEIVKNSTIYRKNDKRHNPHGPAVKWDHGFCLYFINGKTHNIVGPAESINRMTSNDSGFVNLYFINNCEITDEFY